MVASCLVVYLSAETVKGDHTVNIGRLPHSQQCMRISCNNYLLVCPHRLQAEVEEVLEGRTEVTNENLEKLQYTEQVSNH